MASEVEKIINNLFEARFPDSEERKQLIESSTFGPLEAKFNAINGSLSTQRGKEPGSDPILQRILLGDSPERTQLAREQAQQRAILNSLVQKEFTSKLQEASKLGMISSTFGGATPKTLDILKEQGITPPRFTSQEFTQSLGLPDTQVTDPARLEAARDRQEVMGLLGILQDPTQGPGRLEEPRAPVQLSPEDDARLEEIFNTTFNALRPPGIGVQDGVDQLPQVNVVASGINPTFPATLNPSRTVEGPPLPFNPDAEIPRNARLQAATVLESRLPAEGLFPAQSALQAQKDAGRNVPSDSDLRKQAIQRLSFKQQTTGLDPQEEALFNAIRLAEGGFQKDPQPGTAGDTIQQNRATITGADANTAQQRRNNELALQERTLNKKPLSQAVADVLAENGQSPESATPKDIATARAVVKQDKLDIVRETVRTKLDENNLNQISPAVIALEELRSLGEDLFTDGFVNRVLKGGINTFQNLAQTDPNVRLYLQKRQAFALLIGRGATGDRFTDADRLAFEDLIPKPTGILPDSAEVVNKNFDAFERVVTGKLSPRLRKQLRDEKIDQGGASQTFDELFQRALRKTQSSLQKAAQQ